jgi:hypothetical protein
MGNMQGKACFSNAAWTGDRDQAHLWLAQEFVQCRCLSFAAQE